MARIVITSEASNILTYLKKIWFTLLGKKVKVKVFLYKPDVALEVPGG
jgi:hypothetical protein